MVVATAVQEAGAPSFWWRCNIDSDYNKFRRNDEGLKTLHDLGVVFPEKIGIGLFCLIPVHRFANQIKWLA